MANIYKDDPTSSALPKEHSQKVSAYGAFDWINNWLSSPETRRKLQQNIERYSFLFKKPESKWASASTNVDTQLNNQKQNLAWANNAFRVYDHTTEPYNGMGIMGMYDYSPENGKARDIWVSPRNIEANKEVTDRMIKDGDEYALDLGYPSIFNLTTEEMVHASEPYPQEVVAEAILKEEGQWKYDVDDWNKEYLYSGAEVYASLQRLRRLTGLKPGQNIDAEWIKQHKKEIEESRLGGMDPEVLIRLNNELAMSNPGSQQAYYAHDGGPINYMSFFKEGGIHIKKSNKGKFTDYCGGKVTEDCIQKGKHSSDSAVRKRATFAENARKWKH